MELNQNNQQKILNKLNELRKRQAEFQQEINELEKQILRLSSSPEPKPEAAVKDEISKETIKQSPWQIKEELQTTKKKYPQKKSFVADKKKSELNIEIEKFIGENLISKIGIGILIIGVGIGVKYAIDNNLISPIMRIILGYLVGGILTFFALRLKKKYINFSAVLISGAMAVHYFISYAAYTYYGLYPHSVTFVLMVLITIITVALALYYNQQVIAHFGMVGAYIVPFLLKDPNSSVLVLFSYMVLINSGILFISTKKKWKPLNYLAFIATWVIFFTWFLSQNYNNQLAVSLTFASIFFVIFYSVFLSYKLILKEELDIDDIFFLLANATVFWLIGVVAISGYTNDIKFQGIFTLVNVIFHGVTAVIIYRSKTDSNKLFFWTIGMMITLLTISVELLFDTSLKAVFWSSEAIFLFIFGRGKKIILFDYFSFALLCILLLQLLDNWTSISYNFYTDTIKNIHVPVFRFSFISSLAVIITYFTVFYFNGKTIPEGKKVKSWLEVFNVLVPIFLLLSVFFTINNEIELYWNNTQIYSTYELNHEGIWEKSLSDLNQDIFSFKFIWQLNYAILFFSVLAFINFKWKRNNVLNATVFIASGLLILIFLTGGLNTIGQLRESFQNTVYTTNYNVSIFHILIRYVSYLFFALLFYSVYRFAVPNLTIKPLRKIFEIVLSISVIWILSSELINWLQLSGSSELYKHGLSILWGVFSLLLVIYGIWKKKMHLRITAIALFGITLLKLFFYDLSNLSTIQKTIVFVLVGALLLIVSFLYNKYKNVIFESE